MNNLQSYSPLSRPTYYDSLASREGCEPISGNAVLGWIPFDTICVFRHDPASRQFNQPDTVSYSMGPIEAGNEQLPFVTSWAVWVATAGVRAARWGFITLPSDTLGDPSTLYADDKPSKLSHAFNNDGLLAIAIQKTTGTIELKKYTTDTGIIAIYSWAGRSCVLYNLANLASSFKTKRGILAMYLRVERPNVIFGRFELDTTPFGIEHILVDDVRSLPARLIGLEAKGRKQVLRFIDVDGRDVTLTSPDYTVFIAAENKVGVISSLESGEIRIQGVPISTPTEKATITLALESGLVYDALIEPPSPNDSTLPIEKFSVLCQIDSGEVIIQ